MLLEYRVVTASAPSQTVDILPQKDYKQWQSTREDYPETLLKAIPYLSNASGNQYLPYEWGDILAGNGPSPELKKHIDRNGTSFAFGQHGNPAYTKHIYQKYYKDRGEHFKTSSYGELYRPYEGSYCIYDSVLGVVIGFYQRNLEKSKSYLNENDGEQIPDEFNSLYHRTLNSGDVLTDVLSVSSDSKGYYTVFNYQATNTSMRSQYEEYLKNNTTFGDFQEEYLVSHRKDMYYPFSSINLDWERKTPPQVHFFTEHYKRSKQDDFKRINEVYNLSTSVVNYSNKAIIQQDIGLEDSKQGKNVPLFDNNSTKYYDPQKNTLSISNYFLDDQRIFQDYGTADDLNIDSITSQYFKEQFDYHISPESGIKHTRDGKWVIYSDISRTHADGSKPLDIDEYYNSTSDFYNNALGYRTNYLNYLELYKKPLEWYTLDTPPGTVVYKFPRYDLRELKKDTNPYRNMVPQAERGSYFIIDPAYVEISSDTSKGGWFLTKASKNHNIVREYAKTNVMMPYDSLRKLIARPDLYNFNFNPGNSTAFQYEIFTDSRIREGTWSIEAPLTSTKSFRTFNQALRSYVMEVKGPGGAYGHQAGIYIGTSSEASPGETEGITDDSGPYNDDGLILISAGGPGMTGTMDAAMSRAAQTGKGRIVLDAHEIQFKCSRFLIGEIRDDQKERMSKVNIGETLLSCIPVFGSIAQKVGSMLYAWFPVRNEFNKSSIL